MNRGAGRRCARRYCAPVEWWQGVLQSAVGGLLALAGAWTVARHGARDKKREHIRRVAADLIGQTDHMWTMDQAVHMAVYSLMNAERNSMLVGEERREILAGYDGERRDAMSAYNEANRRSRALAAELELLDSDLRASADRLVKASHYRGERHAPLPDEEAKREQSESLAAFIRQVRSRT